LIVDYFFTINSRKDTIKESWSHNAFDVKMNEINQNVILILQYKHLFGWSSKADISADEISIFCVMKNDTDTHFTCNYLFYAKMDKGI